MPSDSPEFLSIRPDALAQVAALVAVGVAIAGLWIWWTFLRRKRLIQDLPTSSARGLSLGLNELVGRAECDDPAVSPQASVECVWWRNQFYVENGDNGWKKTGDKVGGPIGFALVDDTGSIEVRPRKAEVLGVESYDGVHVVSTFSADDPNPTLATRHIAAMTIGRKKRRVVEHTIPLGSEVYVLGTAQLPYERLVAHIGQDRDGADPFLVRVGTETDALYRERVGVGIGCFLAWVSAAAAPIAWRDGEALWTKAITWGDIEPWPPIVGVGVVLAVMAALSVLFAYNGLVRLRQRAQAAWSLIEVQLRRRHDLIPALEQVVKAHATHESEVQRAVASLRSDLATPLPTELSDAAVRTADAQIATETSGLRRLLALIEAYPALTADESFGELRATLVDTENRIALARSFYNSSVQVLHDRAHAVPGNLIAVAFGLDLHVEFTDIAGPAPPAVAVSPLVSFPTALPPTQLRERLRA